MIILRLLAVALLFAFTSSASARVNWHGTIMVVALSGASCAPDGNAVGNNALASFRPSGLSDNGADSFLGLFQTRNAHSYRFAGRRPGTNTPYSAVGIGSTGNNYTFTGGTLSFTTSPATLTETTPFVLVNARFTNWQGTLGCTATVHGAFVLRR